jgi:hypothetical protein
MLTEILKNELKGLRYEIIDLNQSSYFFALKINRLRETFFKRTRVSLLEELITMRYLENGIILHLTNLDDDNSNYSFRKTRKVISKNPLIAKTKEFKNLKIKLNEYRRSINHLKTKHRNKRIAHINTDKFPEINEFLNFNLYVKPLIEKANEIADIIWGAEINVKLKIGSIEGILDFRNELKNINTKEKETDTFKNQNDT